MNHDIIGELFEIATKWSYEKYSKKETGYTREYWVAYKMVELVKQEIHAIVKEELMDDSLINAEPDKLNREYLKGCNGGTVDALCHIKNFGADIEL